MANQGRNDTENRGNDRMQSGTSAGSPTNPTGAPNASSGGGPERPANSAASAGASADRAEDYYLRAEAARERGYRFDRERGERAPGSGYNFERGTTPGYASDRGREWDSTQALISRGDQRGEFLRGWRDRGPQAVHGGSEAYGDYGHPGRDYREAYGDMGTRDWESGRGRRWNREMKRARDVMTRNPRTAQPIDSIQQVARIMVDEDTGIVPLCDENMRLLGVVTDRDIVCRLINRGVDVRSARAGDAMSVDLECVTEQDSLIDVLRVMGEHQVRRVPVVARGDRLVGIISMADIAREADLDEELQMAFEEISSERGFWSRLR